MWRSAEFWLRVTAAMVIVLLPIVAPGILFPFGLSLFLAILLKPLATGIQKAICRMGLTKFPYDVSIVAAFLIFLAVLYLIATYVLVPFGRQFQEFIKQVPAVLNEVQQAILRLEAQYSVSAMPQEGKQLIGSLLEKLGNYTLSLASFSLSAVFTLASTMIELIVVPVITFYMIKMGGRFVRGFIVLFPETYRPHLSRLFEEMHRVLSAYIVGQLSLSVLMTVVVFLGMLALGIPYPLVIGLLAGVVEMIPVVGPIVGAIPAILLGLAESSGLAVKVLIFYIVVQQLDAHLVMPKLMGSVTNVHPVAIILGVLVGGQLYGIVGMMVAVPVLAVLQILLRHMWYYDTYKK